MTRVKSGMSHSRAFVLALACAAGCHAASADDPPRQSAEEQALFADLPRVEAAALHAQTLAEAPANVSVITAVEIRRYGYRTLAEVLASVRGFYATYDHTYHYVGVRGIALPGDFNTRFLVMLNGHPLTDNIYNSNGFFGQDFGLDMDLVERIEIIRGPTSALYGSNGMLTNINVVTRSPVDGERLRVSTETGTGGERKLGLSSSLYLGHGANLLVAASTFHNGGISIPGDAAAGRPATGPEADGERGYHTFANLIWHDWSFTGYFNSRDKQPPVGVGASLSGDPSQHVVDGRNLVAATYKRRAGPGEVQWQFSYDQYRYRDRYDYAVEDEILPMEDFNRGDWLDSQLTYALPVGLPGLLTVGVAGMWELRNQQYNVVQGTRQDILGRTDHGVALFAQQQWNVSRRWQIYGGVRVDDTRNFHRFVSPRLAAVFQPSPRTAYKLVYGRPFRNPSSFEMFYNDGGLSYATAAPLHPERAQTLEASLERQMVGSLALVVNAFHYQIDRVIEAVALDNGALQYRNAGELRSTGVELELSGKLRQRVEVQASTALQRAVGGSAEARLANSPHQVTKLSIGVPLWRERLFVSGAARYLSPRLTGTGERLDGVPLVDCTATMRLHPRLDLITGLRNSLGRGYEDPVYLSVDRLPGDGRSFFVKLVWRVWE